MESEAASIDDDVDALAWSLGCAAASYRQRARPVTVLMFGSRIAVAAAASLFGIVHLGQAQVNVPVKLALMRGGTPEVSAVHRQIVESLPLEHWIAQAAILAAIGILHLIAAGALLAGRLRAVGVVAVAVSGLALAAPVLGHGGLTFPIFYLMLVALMAGAGGVMARIEQWDNARA